ncbi:MAG: T9SS type A sorting domain-containing protein [Bacteroidota bacterium]
MSHEKLRLILTGIILLFTGITSMSQSSLSVEINATPQNPCAGSNVQLEAIATGGSGDYNYSWVSNPGNFTYDGQSFTANPDVTTTFYVVVYDVTNNNSAQDDEVVNVVPHPTADAGQDELSCSSDATIQLSTASASNYTSVQWSTQGDGEFNTGFGNPVNPTYEIGEQDIQNGEVTLTLYAFPLPQCQNVPTVSDQMTLEIISEPEVDAGDDTQICGSETLSLSADAENYSALNWSSDGDGYFEENQDLETTYVPLGDDLEGAPVQLTLTASAIDPCTDNVSDYLTAEVIPEPEAIAGDDAEICEGSNYTFSDNNVGSEHATSVSWSTEGDGNFQNPNQLESTYIPGEGDISNGEVELILTADGEDACNNETASDTMTLHIIRQPVIEASAPETVCETDTINLSATVDHSNELIWTSSGTGEFTNDTATETEYIPSEEDIANEEVTISVTAQAISPCSETDMDEITITFDPLPIVDAGNGAESCDNEPFELNGSVENASVYEWSTEEGDGSFDDNTILNPAYTPGTEDAQNGSVVLTLTAQSAGQCDDEISDSMELTFIPGPQINAGSDAAICETSEFETAGTASNASETEWNTSGDGSFIDPSELITDYEPGEEDIASGEVYLTLTGSNESCNNTQDSLLLTITPAPTADAGADTSFCVDAQSGGAITFSLNAATADEYSEIEWSTDGDGEFSDPSALNPEYTFTDNDIEEQEVTLTLNAYANDPCTGSASDAITLSFYYNPIANAGSDDEVCEGTEIQLDGTGSFIDPMLQDTVVFWKKISESGEITNQNSLEASYSPNEEDYENGEVSFELMIDGECETDFDTVTYQIQRSPKIDAGGDTVICNTETEIELEAESEFANGIQWNAIDGADGDFDDDEISNPIYTIGEDDISDGFVKLVVSGWAQLPCDTPARDTLEITILDNPSVDLGDDMEACWGESVDLTASAENFSTFEWSSSGDGEFSGQDLETQYTIGEEDAENGEVTITFTAEPDFPCSETEEDQLIIFIKEGAAIELEDIVDANYNESYTFEPEVTSNSDNLSYYWEPEDMVEDPEVKNATTEPFPVDGPDSYLFTFSVTNEENGCVVSDTSRVYLELGEIVIGMDESVHVCEGGSVTLDADASGGTGDYSYYWQAGDDSGWTSENSNPTVSPEEETTYTVTVNDGNTSPSAEITVFVESTPNTPSIESGAQETEQGAEEVYTTTGSDLAYYEWWAKNGSVTEGQGTKAATIEWGSTGTGIVYLRMASEFGCFGDTSQYAVSIGTISVAEIPEMKNLQLYPNPAKDRLNIAFSLDSKQDIRYEVIDSRGNLVLTKPSKAMQRGSQKLTIDMQTWPEGMYVLKLMTDEHHAIKRFIKQR